MVDPSTIAFEELFNLDDIQLLQDQFAKATGVASIITRTDGTPITRPSNFTHLCREIFTPREKVLSIAANPMLCLAAYQSLQQARFITDLEKALEKLQESENRLRFAPQGANDGLRDANLLAGEVNFNQRSYEILGYSSRKMAGAIGNWKTLVHPDDFPLTWELIVAHFKKPTPILRIELRMCTQKGWWKWVLTRGKVVELCMSGFQHFLQIWPVFFITDEDMIDKPVAEKMV